MAHSAPTHDRSSKPDSLPSWDGARLYLSMIGAAVAVCELDGTAVGITPEAQYLLQRLGIDAAIIPFKLPEMLWRKLARVPTGEATEWSPEGDLPGCLGCTRYPLGDRHTFLLMREVSNKRRQLARSLHRQRLESTGKLVASIVHDLRAPLAGIVYHAELLAQCGPELSQNEAGESLSDIRNACRRLQRTIDGLLDYARLGPQLDVNLSLLEIFDRVASFVRPILREGGHAIECQIAAGAEWVRGNPIAIEQVFVNLIVNATEARPHDARIELLAGLESHELPRPRVRVEVRDNGPGVPEGLLERVFDPFFSTKSRGTGLGLAVSRDALRDLGGELSAATSDSGGCFLVFLPRGTAPDTGTNESS